MKLIKTTIGELGRIVTGKTPSFENPHHFGDEFPFLTPTDLRYGERTPVCERFLSEEGAAALHAVKLPRWSIAYVCIGATIGKIALVERDSFSNQQINSVIVDNERHDPRFVFYLLKHISPSIIKQATGAATPIINKSKFSAIAVDVPDRRTQYRIAEILSAYDDLIENNNRRMTLLEESIHLLFRQWFVNLRFPGHERVRIIDGVPEGWTKTRLGDLVYQLREAVHPEEVNPATPYVGLEHIPRRCIALSEWGVAEDVSSGKLRFEKRDILFGKIRPYFHKVVFAPVGGICSSDTIVMRPKAILDFGLVLAVTASVAFVDQVWQSARIGAKMPRADWKVMSEYPLLRASDSVHNQFNEFVNNVVAQIENFLLVNRQLREARDLLLPRLMDGRITV